MTRRIEASRVAESHPEDFRFAPVDRTRLARYLDLPSEAEIDEVTDAEIRKLEQQRDEWLEFSSRAIALPIDRIEGKWIELEGGNRVEATAAYGRQLRKSAADWLIIAAFTVGGRVDAGVKSHLAADGLFEAFVLKQWAATMTEQARSRLTLSLCGWADHQGRSLLPYNGPGYNNWPLTGLDPLLQMLQRGGAPDAALPVRALDSGMLLPVNSMLIVYGATPRRVAVARRESLAQCHRCAMRNCRFRISPLDENSEPEIVGLAR